MGDFAGWCADSNAYADTYANTNSDADINADSNSNSDANANADCKDDSVQCCKLCDRRSRSKFNPFRHPLRRHQWHSDRKLRHQRQRRLAEL